MPLLRHLTETGFGSFLLLVLWRIAFLAHGLSAHLDAVGIVHQAIQDTISDSGIADLLVPTRNRQLGMPQRSSRLQHRANDGIHTLVGVYCEPLDFFAAELARCATFSRMKRIFLILGVILFVLGIVALLHPSFDYHKHEEVARIGPITATVEKPETTSIPAPVTVALLVSGLVLIVLAVRTKP